MPKIKNIIFDLGGVLLNIDPDAVARNLVSIGLDSNKVFGNQGVKDLLLEFETGHVSTLEFRARMKKLVDREDLDDSVFDQIWCSILLDFNPQSIETLLDVRKKYRIFLLSNTNQLHYDSFSVDFLKRYGYSFDSLFEQVFYSFHMGLAKPDRAIFETVLTSMALAPDETLFIDDTSANTESASLLGLHTIHVVRNVGVFGLPELYY